MTRPILTKEFLEQHLSGKNMMSVRQMAIEYSYGEMTIRNAEKKFGIRRSSMPQIKSVLVSQRVAKHTANWTSLAEMTPNSAYYLGFFYADGSLYRNKSATPTMRFGWGLKATDRYIIEQFLKDHDATYPISTIKAKRTEKGKKGSWNKSEHVHLSICSIDLANILCAYGMNPDHEYKEHLPKIYNISSFLLGLLDGDGHITFKRGSKLTGAGDRLVVGYSIKSETFRDELIKFLADYGYKASWCKDKSIFSVFMYCDTAERFLDWIYEDAERFLTRKHDKYLWWKNYRQEHPKREQTLLTDRNRKILTDFNNGIKPSAIAKEHGITSPRAYNLIKKLKENEHRFDEATAINSQESL